MQQLLGDRSADNASTTRGGDETHHDTAALASHLAGHGVGLSDLVTPVPTAHWHHRQLSQDDGTADGSGHFLGALDTQTDVTVEVTNGHKSLETGSLTGTGLLLHGHDLQHLVLQGCTQEIVDNLELLQRSHRIQ